MLISDSHRRYDPYPASLWLRHASRPWNARSINPMLGTIQPVLDDAVSRGRVARNVVALMDRLPQDHSGRQGLPPSRESRQVLAHARSERLEVASQLALRGMHLCFTTTYASWANPIKADFGPL